MVLAKRLSPRACGPILGLSLALSAACTSSVRPSDAGVDASPTDAGPDYGLRFDGVDDRATVESDPTEELDAAFTMEVWVRTAVRRLMVIASTRSFAEGADADGMLFGLYINGEPFLQVQGSPNILSVTTREVVDGEWHHLAVTRSASGTVQLFIDGAEVVTSPASRPGSLASVAPLTIGIDVPSGYPFEGDLYDLRLWSVARTPAEIASAMSEPPPPDAPGLLAHWPFDEGQGDVAQDRVGGRDAALGADPFAPVWFER